VAFEIELEERRSEPVVAVTMQPAGLPWEVYLTDPAKEPNPSRWRTDVVLPVR